MNIKAVKQFVQDIPQGISENVRKFLIHERVKNNKNYIPAVNAALEIGRQQARKELEVK